MRHILKNRLLTVVKNYDTGTLIRNLPGVAMFTLVKTLDFARVHPTAALGLVDAVRLLPAALRKRRWMRARRRAEPAQMASWLLPFPWRGRLLRRASLAKGSHEDGAAG
jgi:hypothetical protein